MTSGQYHHSRYEDMSHDRRKVEAWWETISEYVLPRKSFVTEQGDEMGIDRYAKLYDTTAIDACNTLANGHSSYITPGDQRWFYWSAPEHLRTEESEMWYRKCSEIAALELASSNFYTTLDESYLDRSGFGIAAVSCWPGRTTSLNFKVHPVNSYCIEESDEGYVDTIYFLEEIGIRQLRQWFGDEIERSDKLAEAWKAFEEKGTNTKHQILHCVYPREERQASSAEGRNLPVASVYVCFATKDIIYESGFEEMNYMCSRYLKHTGRGNQYGFSPSWRVMPTIGQLNFIQKAMDFMAEKQAVPSILVPDYLEGEVDLRAGGQTMFQASRVKGAYALPQEWGNQGRYDVGVHRVEQKQEEINRAFHVDLFRMFATIDRPNMTATEVAERSGEKMIQFSPSFTRFVADFQVLMRRVFGVLLRAGKFPPPPDDAIQQNPYTGQLSVDDPKVIYQSKIALALQQLQNSGIDRLFMRAQALVAETGRVDVLDNFDFDRTFRLMGRNDGVPEEVFSDEQVMQEIRARRAEQQAQEQQMAEIEQGAKAAGAVGLKVA